MELAASLLVRWWRQAGWGRRTVALLGVVGVACVAASLLPSPGLDASWVRDFLMTVGSSLALFAPFYLLTRSLDRHLDQVAADTAEQVEGVRVETAQQVADVRTAAAEASIALTGQVEALRADVDRRLSDVANRVSERLAAEAAADTAAFDSLRTNAPTREAVWNALERAHGLGLVSAYRPPRVNISPNSALYVAFDLDLSEWADAPLRLRIERLSGHVEDWIDWPADQTAEVVLIDVGRALRKHTGETLDAAALLVGLADLLDASLSHPDRRPAIELCPPQWIVCEWGVNTYGAHNYGVRLHQLQTSPTIETHVAEKTWVDGDSWEAAYTAALALFPRSSDPWTSVGTGEPQF